MEIFPLRLKRELSDLNGAQREKIFFFSSDTERKMAKNRGICAAHTCIPQYREYPPRNFEIANFSAALPVSLVFI